MHLRLKHKISAVAFFAAVLPVLVILFLTLIQKKQASKLINETMQEMIVDELRIVVGDFYSLCKTANDFTQQYVNHSLNIAREKLYQEGLPQLASQKIKWQAVNQFSKHVSEVQLPKMMINGKWQGQNMDLNTFTPVVDDVKELLGATCTIFQRINERGDMLRVATNVETLDKVRAIATYIPAINPDGQNNPVVASVLKGNIFLGRAFVVNDWYLTAYEPIRDGKANIIGMLYVGVKQESAESFRESVLHTRVGHTGYLYAVGGRGSHKGHYAVSKNGLQDGQFILDRKDAGGAYYVQDIIHKALDLENGAQGQKIYARNEDGVQRKVITLYTYFEPWDWVIGANAFEEDFAAAREKVDAVLYRLVTQTLLWGLIILGLSLIFAFYLSSKIARPLIQMAGHTKVLASGDFLHSIDYNDRDEIGILAASYNKMATEIHEQREKLVMTNQRLTEANATKDKFFSIIAHDLKNPFNTILTSSAALVQMFNTLDGEKLKKGIEALNRSANRGYNLLVDLLNWARSQSGKIQYNMDNVDLADLVDENIALLRDRANEKGIRLESGIPEETFVWTDKNMVSTILRNLMTNAVKFTGRDGHVRITCESAESECKVIVEDTGIGMSAENIKKLFRLDTFYRTPGTEKEKGSGLGLILCKEFLDKLGGEIYVESQPAKGSRFIFTLPGETQKAE